MSGDEELAKQLAAQMNQNTDGEQPVEMLPGLPANVDYDNIPPEFLGGDQVVDATPAGVSPPAGPPVMGAGVSPEEVNAMSRVLESLNSVGESTVSNVVKEAKREPLMEEYVSASLTGDTIKRKNFEIRVREIESFKGNKKVYDIIESSTREVIADDLFLYEAANSIVKYLNKGHNLLSPEVREVIGLEQKYADFRTDAGIFRKRYSEAVRRNPGKADLYETRFNSARDKALETKKKLKKISESI